MLYFFSLPLRNASPEPTLSGRPPHSYSGTRTYPSSPSDCLSSSSPRLGDSDVRQSETLSLLTTLALLTGSPSPRLPRATCPRAAADYDDVRRPADVRAASRAAPLEHHHGTPSPSVPTARHRFLVGVTASARDRNPGRRVLQNLAYDEHARTPSASLASKERTLARHCEADRAAAAHTPPRAPRLPGRALDAQICSAVL